MQDFKRVKQMISLLIGSKISKLLVNNQKPKNNALKWILKDVYKVFHLQKFYKLGMNGTVLNVSNINWRKNNSVFTGHPKF